MKLMRVLAVKYKPDARRWSVGTEANAEEGEKSQSLTASIVGTNTEIISSYLSLSFALLTPWAGVA